MARESTDRISLFADGEETVLCDWTDSVQEGADAAMDNELQIVRYVRAEKIRVIDRASESVTLTFVVNQEWRDDVKAFDFFTRVRKVIPRFGNLTWKNRNGRSTLSRYLVDCGVKVKPTRRMGCATWVQYTCIGGEITTTPPKGQA